MRVCSGFKSNCEMTALTHFSRRLVKGIEKPKYSEAHLNSYAKKRVFESLDHLQFRLSEMGNLPKICAKIPDSFTINRLIKDA